MRSCEPVSLQSRDRQEALWRVVSQDLRALFLLLISAGIANAQVYGRPALLRNVGLDQKMGAQVPLDRQFFDEAGNSVHLSEYLGKPAILALVYYQCPSLCNLVLNGIAASARNLKLTPGTDYNIIAVSFDPRESSQLAAQKREAYAKGSAQGWHFLTAPQTSSKALADAVGFHYAYDPVANQYAHPSAIMLLTPEGRVARYLYGINYQARDVRLGLVEASNNRIGSPVDQVLLFCFHYDPANGKYGFVIMNVIRAGGILTVLALLSLIIFLQSGAGPRPAAASQAALPPRGAT